MAQRKSEEDRTIEQVLKLVEELSPEGREEVLEKLKLDDMRREIQKGILHALQKKRRRQWSASSGSEHYLGCLLPSGCCLPASFLGFLFAYNLLRPQIRGIRMKDVLGSSFGWMQAASHDSAVQFIAGMAAPRRIVAN